MTIAQMHVWFRQYAQQMGMQNVRAILPEQIDLLINTSITDIVNQVIVQNINVTNDRIITDNSRIGQINALRTLYKVRNVDTTIDEQTPYPSRPFSKDDSSGILHIFGDIVNFDYGEVKYYTIVESNSTYTATTCSKEVYDNTPLIKRLDNINQDEIAYYENEDYKDYALRVNPEQKVFDYLYLVDFSLNYRDSSNKITNYFPVRLIDDIYLADTLNDFILRPRLRTPIAVTYNGKLDLYIDVLDFNGDLPQGLTPNELRISYLAKPDVVAYRSDIGGTDVKCNLPDYMHVDILKHAVDLYRIAVGNGMYNSQQQQVQNPSTARTAGTGSEGYQS